MKKFILKGFSIVLVLCVVMSVASCSLGDPFKKFTKKLERKESCKVTMSFNVDGVGRVVQIFYVDNNVIYYEGNDTLRTDAYYVEIVDDYLVEYTKNFKGTWKKSKTKNDFNLEENDIFNSDNYIQDPEEKGVYRQKRNVIFEQFEDVVVAFLDDFVVIECVMMVDKIEANVKMVISNIGEYELTLPEVE